MSFYNSISGLKNAQTGLNVISHNIANAETNGFKRSRVEFADVVASSASADPKKIQGIGSTVEKITQNFAVGPIEQTGASLDLAIGGDGFFQLTSAINGKMLFTRNGSFSIDDEGYINDGSSNRLQAFAPGAGSGAMPGDVQVPAVHEGAGFAGVTVGGDGVIRASYADGSNLELGTVALVSFIAPSGLKPVGNSNWQATGLSGEPQYGVPDSGAFGPLLAGSIEHSNVDIAEELVNLITAQRYFQANAKAIDTATQISQTIIGLRS